MAKHASCAVERGDDQKPATNPQEAGQKPNPSPPISTFHQIGATPLSVGFGALPRSMSMATVSITS